MRLLILGGSGMAGHMIADYFEKKTDHEVWITLRQPSHHRRAVQLDARDEGEVKQTLATIHPQVVVNTIGILNDQAKEQPMDAIRLNSLLPHVLATEGNKLGFRLIHVSTDCVFSGKKGDYRENDRCDGYTPYANSKRLGEVHQHPHLTIRTSIIGPELNENGIGLLHWFLSQKGDVEGYREVFWSGVTTLELAKTIHWCLKNPTVTGLAHLTALGKISKYHLLKIINKSFNRNQVTIFSNDAIRSDKSLINTRKDFPRAVTPYPKMIHELHEWIKTSQREYPYA